jgi:hypothetical protein
VCVLVWVALVVLVVVWPGLVSVLVPVGWDWLVS